jgi:hypothetical protein
MLMMAQPVPETKQTEQPTKAFSRELLEQQ